jgi:hypothetical protein
VCGGKRVTATWNEVNDMFYEQNELQDLKEANYKKDNANSVRKLRDHFNTVVKTVSDDIASGNQSGKEGDLNTLYKYVKEIVKGINEKEVEKSAPAQLESRFGNRM